jgi:hypothetical protein
VSRKNIRIISTSLARKFPRRKMEMVEDVVGGASWKLKKQKMNSL